MKALPVTLTASLLVIAGCTMAPPAPAPRDDGPADDITGGDSTRPTPPPSNNPAPQDNGDDPGSPTDDPPAAPSSPYACTAAGIAAYADMLVQAGRKSCTAHGVGVVDMNDFTCMKTAIDGLAPPHPTESFNVINTLLAGNTQYPKLECTYFVQAVTAGACATPISPSDMAWTAYPLAAEFANKSIPHYTWIPNSGTKTVAVGDILVYGASNAMDPGHIMIVIALVDATHFRVAEANELTSTGARATAETGVVSNTRVTTRQEPHFVGWFRLTP